MQRLGDGLVCRDLGNELVDTLADDFGLDITEHPLTGGIEGLNDPILIHREHHILDVVENHLQMLGALFARLVRHGARFVRHEPHGLDDAATLLVDGVVVRTQQLQQDAQVRSGCRVSGR
jgi:hypothetical protein